jgi:hypothetical protein
VALQVRKGDVRGAPASTLDLLWSTKSVEIKLEKAATKYADDDQVASWEVLWKTHALSGRSTQAIWATAGAF